MIDMTTLQDFLAQTPSGPFVSIYLPREPHQDVAAVHLQLRHLIAHAKDVMTETFPEQAWAPYDDQLTQLFDTPQRITGNTTRGLGVVCDSTRLQAFALDTPVVSSAMVTTYPQILPLLADAQKQHDFDVLVLQRDRIALYRNDHDTLAPVALPEDAPQTLVGTLGGELRGGNLNSVSQGPGTVSYHGHTDKSTEEANDTKRFFQAVDEYIGDHYSKPSQRPLVLWGLPQTLAVFREVSRNPLLTTIALEVSPANPKATDLARAANTLIGDFDAQARHALLAELDAARSGGRIVETLDGVVDAINTHAVAHLLLQEGARVNGQLQDSSLDQKSPQAQHNNLLNDLAELAVIQGGRVSLLPPTQLSAPVVAILRYTK
ncbi:baeRF6 domain-containing protein [Lacticaseibacillus sp. GG6-2]